MRTVNTSLGPPIGGVSEEPLSTRRADAVAECINWMPRGDLGLTRRPPTTLVRSGLPGAYLTDFVDEEGDTKILAIGNFGVRVFDATTDAEETVTTRPGADAYLVGTAGYRTAQFGSDVYVLNRDADAPSLLPDREADRVTSEALIYIRRADFATTYRVLLLDADTAAYINSSIDAEAGADIPPFLERRDRLASAALASASYTTPEASAPSARRVLSTDEVATELADQLRATLPASVWDVEAFGSTLYVRRRDGRSLVVQATDGLADTGVLVVQGTVRSLTDLPPRAVAGFRVKVAGDPASGADDTWLEFRTEGDGTSPTATVGTEFGVWAEVPAPGARTTIDPVTMPHVLRRAAPIASGEVAAPPVPVVGVRQAADGTSMFSSPFTREDDPALSFRTYAGARFVSPTVDALPVAAPASASSIGLDTPGFGGTAYTGTVSAVSVVLSVVVNTETLAADQFLEVEVYSKDRGFDTAATGLTAVARKPDLAMDGDNRVVITPGRRDVRVQFPAFRARVGSQFGLRFLVQDPSGNRIPIAFPSQAAQLGEANWNPATTVTQVAATALSAPMRIVTLPAAPVGTTFTVTVNGVSRTEPTRDALVAAFAGAVTGQTVVAGATADTLIVLPLAGNALADVSATSNFSTTTRALLAGVNPLAGTSLVGAVVRNLTDGSSATVTAHGLTSFESTALSGGVSNRYRRGDRIEFRPAGNPWTFGPETWDARVAGSEETVPAPSIIGRRLTDVVVHRGRLMLVAEDAYVMSVGGNPRGLWRRNSRVVLADDPIDVLASGWRIPRWHDVHEWGRGVTLVGDEDLWFVTAESDGPLTPQSARLAIAHRLTTTPGVPGVTLGDSLLLPRARNGASQVRAVQPSETGLQTVNLSSEVPTYLSGTPIALAAHDGLGIAILATTSALYLGVVDGREGRPAMTWSRWIITGAVAAVTDLLLVRDVLWLVMSDGAILRMRLDSGDPTGAADAPYRDRRTLAGTGGVAFSSVLVFSPMVRRDQDGQADLRTRRALRYATIVQRTSANLTLVVQREGRTSEERVSMLPKTRMPLTGEAQTTTLAIYANGDEPCRITDVEFEATDFPRTTRR